ncbi:MAG: hypothetical protein HKM05_01205 [Spirochaetales bacterium]|nr:hypothetical protein [Spirochaetales bacterium]
MLYDFFALALVALALYYGRIAWHLLVSSRPLVQSFGSLAVCLAILGLPFGALVYLLCDRDIPVTWLSVTGPVLYAALVGFYTSILRGVLFYGIPEVEFSRVLRQALESEGAAFSEQIGRIEVLGRDFDLSYSYNPTTGAGLLRFRHLKGKTDRALARRFFITFRNSLKQVYQPRRGLGFLYGVFFAGLLVVAWQLIMTSLRSH